MNTDIRIAIGLTSNPKVLKLMKRCGDRSFFCLISLWTWAAQNRPDGNLAGMDNASIEIAADWLGRDGEFVATLDAVGFVDGGHGRYRLHEWDEHQPDILRSIKYQENNERMYPRDWNRRRYQVFIRDNFTCVYCGKNIDKPHADHVFPRSRGGSDDIDNLATSCPSCNMSKGSKTIEEWLH